MLYKKIFSSFTSTILCVMLLSSCAPEKGPVNTSLEKYGISIPSTSNMEIIRDFLQPAKGKTFHTIIAQDKDIRLEIEMIRPMTPEEASSYANTKYEIIKDLYGPKTIPYPAAITQLTGAPEGKKPIELSANILGQKTPVLIANASERYVLGVWEEELIAQKCAFTVFYDTSSKTNYQIMVFFHADEYDEAKALNMLTGIKRTSSEK